MAQITFSTMREGWTKGAGLPPARRPIAACITSAQMGAAPVRPLVPSISVLSGLPTQTPTARSGVKPRVQLSRKSPVVPVLAATLKGKLSTELAPNIGWRAGFSEEEGV